MNVITYPYFSLFLPYFNLKEIKNKEKLEVKD